MSQSDQRDASVNNRNKLLSRKTYIVLGILLIILVVARPGVFTIQPIGALPEGLTFVYHSRTSPFPLFSSPDALCLEIQGSVTVMCRLSAMSASGHLTDRIILRLPYSRWAYLRSTGGLEFDR